MLTFHLLHNMILNGSFNSYSFYNRSVFLYSQKQSLVHIFIACMPLTYVALNNRAITCKRNMKKEHMSSFFS